MKRWRYFGTLWFAMVMISGCNGNSTAVTQVITDQIEAETEHLPETEEIPETETYIEYIGPDMFSSEALETFEYPESDVDVDLTMMSTTMVYTQVYNMMLYPERYIGKTVRVKGQYYATYWGKNDVYYQYVIIADALACCQQGLEFIWDDGIHNYPEDFTEVEIVGTFCVYQENEYECPYLATDRINILQ